MQALQQKMEKICVSEEEKCFIGSATELIYIPNSVCSFKAKTK